MKSRRSAWRLVFTGVLGLMLLATSAASARTKHGKPFKVKAEYVVAASVDPGCAGLRVIAGGTAHASHLGESAWNDVECSVFNADGSASALGQLVLTAANGDQLLMVYDLTTTPIDSEGNIHPVGPFTIVGGTGRFDDAHGSGMLTAVVSLVTFTAIAELDGELFY